MAGRSGGLVEFPIRHRHVGKRPDRRAPHWQPTQGFSPRRLRPEEQGQVNSSSCWCFNPLPALRPGGTLERRRRQRDKLVSIRPRRSGRVEPRQSVRSASRSSFQSAPGSQGGRNITDSSGITARSCFNPPPGAQAGRRNIINSGQTSPWTTFSIRPRRSCREEPKRGSSSAVCAEVSIRPRRSGREERRSTANGAPWPDVSIRPRRSRPGGTSTGPYYTP